MPLLIINVLLSTFPGLGLPTTLNFPTVETTPISHLMQQILARLPPSNNRYILTTNTNKELIPSGALISSLLPSDVGLIFPLRLTVPLCGGKGGFGSQLRAAGGRMSSKRKKTQGDANSSNRNLDGRRLRTVNEAKALAEYLALKPDMEKKEKEARRKRWEQVVELAERREEGIRNDSRGKVDGKWVEAKEEAVDRAREAVVLAMTTGNYRDNLVDSSTDDYRNGSIRHDGRSENGLIDGLSNEVNAATVPSNAVEPGLRAFAGFEDDDEFMSDSEEDEPLGLDEIDQAGAGEKALRM